MFFAVWPTAEVVEALTPLAHEIASGEGRAQASENFHLTLAFLGDVTLDRLDDLRSIGAAAARAVAPFRLALDYTGSFKQTGIVWLGASKPSPGIRTLAGGLRDALGAQGFSVDRHAFQPHVTLVRKCRHQVRLMLGEPILWPIDRLVLNASEPGRSAPRYREIISWPLGAPSVGAY